MAATILLSLWMFIRWFVRWLSSGAMCGGRWLDWLARDLNRISLHRGKLAGQTRVGKLQTRSGIQRRNPRLECSYSSACAG